MKLLSYLLFSTALLLTLVLTECSAERASGTPGILVSTRWLQDHLHDADLVLLHSGSGDLFDSIHIPGARLIDPYSFTTANESLRNEMPHQDSIVALLEKVGVDTNSKIVLCYESASLLTRTARVYVALDYLGLGDRTFVLNGGLAAWQEEERETTAKVLDFSEGKLASGKLKEVIISATELDLLRWNQDVVIIDARRDDEYYGIPETEDTFAEGGHIEGAYFLPYQDLLSDDQPYLFRDDTELNEEFKRLGVDADKKTIVYCGSGIRASATYLAALHSGYPVLLYDGSYEDWEELKLPLTGPVPVPIKND